MSTLPSSPEKRKLLADKIVAFNKAQVIKDAASDTQNTIKADVKDQIGMPTGEFTRRAKIARLEEDNPSKFDELRELDENIYEEHEMIFKDYQPPKEVKADESNSES